MTCKSSGLELLSNLSNCFFLSSSVKSKSWRGGGGSVRREESYAGSSAIIPAKQPSSISHNNRSTRQCQRPSRCDIRPTDLSSQQANFERIEQTTCSQCIWKPNNNDKAGGQRVRVSWKANQFLMASRHLVWLPVQGTGGLPCHSWWVWSWGGD